MTMRLLTAALILLAGVSTAAADIRIDQSRYEDGKLMIAGVTTPDSTVTLDHKYKTKSDADGDFKFTEHYKPFTCMSDIRAGASTYSAVIAGCLDPGFDGNTMPVKKAAAIPAQ
jgi:hypothetical protein